MLVDTDAFTNFIRDQGREEGCGQNGLMEESMKQAERAGSSSDELGPRMDGCQTVFVVGNHASPRLTCEVRSALFGMAFLRHRFQAAQLPAPPMEVLTSAIQRLKEAYSKAVTEHCK